MILFFKKPAVKFCQKNYYKILNSLIIISLSCVFISCAGISSLFWNNKTEMKIVDKIGSISVKGTKLVDKNNNPVALHGMSMFWSQWMDKYYNYNCIKWLRDDWKCTVVRAAMGIERDGYLAKPDSEMNKIKTVIDACIDLGIYVIVDWHDHDAHEHKAEAINFFKEIAKQYGNKPNIIYEIYNEPTKVSWDDVVKPYAEDVIKNIRSIDPDNLIIVGTPIWSQDVDAASANPLKFSNIAYGIHFYAATHKQYLRDKALAAMKNNAALFVSEFGTCEANGNGILDRTELDTWFKFMEDNNLSWCNWSVADKNETASILKNGADPNGNWSASDLSESGLLIREKIRMVNNSAFTYNK